jgi:hypothetical protein
VLDRQIPVAAAAVLVKFLDHPPLVAQVVQEPSLFDT